ncbi:hypothetical protein ABZY31_27335 [Streptomyces sp. NPDC006529]|uniref:glycosyltransferase family 39 protein n=1 Tax=Streptomyces sp. NPDC006529 TaxID=3157177 RepID=UPI0033B6336D
MWRDESVTYQVAHRTSGDLVGLLGQVDAVHGLYYLLMHGVFAVWDGGLWALRLPSVLATALAAAGVAALAHRLGAGERAALLAGSAYAVLPPVQMYAQEGRSYALVTAAVIWATYLLVSECWAAYAVVLALGCWLHEFAVLALLAHGVVAWRSRAWRWCVVAVGVALAPLVLLSAGQAQQQLGWLGRPKAGDWAAYAVIAGAALLLARGIPDRALVRVAVPLALAPPGVLLAVSLVHPLYVDRYVLYALAGLALLVGARLAAGGWVAWVVAGALLVPFGFWAGWLRTPESRKDDVLAVAAAVRAEARPGDAVLFLPARRREWLLSSPGLYAGLRDVALAAPPAASGTLWGTELPDAELRAHLLAAPRVLAVLDPAGEPVDPYPREAVKRQALAAHFDLCRVTSLHGARLAVFAAPGTCP